MKKISGESYNFAGSRGKVINPKDYKNSNEPGISFPFGEDWVTRVVITTLESGIDVGQGINVGPGKFVKKKKNRALNKGRA